MGKANYEIVASSVLIAVSAGMVFWMLRVHHANSGLLENLNREKLASESLLSEKLLLEKELLRISGELSGLKAEKKLLDSQRAAFMAHIATREDKDRMRYKETIYLHSIARQLDAVNRSRSEMELQIRELESGMLESKHNNDLLVVEKWSLQQANKSLNEQLAGAIQPRINQAKLMAVKRNGVATLRGKQTDKILLAVNVPSQLDHLSFRITDSGGNTLSVEDGNLSMNTALAPSTANENGKEMTAVQMVYKAIRKLNPGVYTINILNEGLYVGSLQVNLN